VFMYALGLGIPFILVAIFSRKYVKNMARIRKLIPYISFAGGIFIIIMGIFMVSGKMFT